MNFKESFKANLYNINEASFESAALELFNFQYKNNSLYRAYVDQLKIKPQKIASIYEIPFLPIDFFKQHPIKTGDWKEETTFESSGTTGQIRSKHYIEDLHFYLKTSTTVFEKLYGKVENYSIIALLPSYLERNTSSLVYMANEFIKKSTSGDSGFYLNNYDDLVLKIQLLKNKKTPTIIIGVTFALLELAERFKGDLSDMIIMETGGMKGRREEITQSEVHDIIKGSFSVKNVHTEYGMTELLSQAYAQKEGILEGPLWFKVLIRDVNDPFDLKSKKRTGGVNIIDLANVHSCAFIETKDIGEKVDEKKFKILGRLDNSEIRGCNLLIQ